MISIDDFIRQNVRDHLEGADVLPELSDALATGRNLWSRATFPYHATASVFVVSPERSRTLLLRHRALGKWLQPGGHLDPGEQPMAAASRELKEELGITATTGLISRGDGRPISINIHAVPENPKKGEPSHFHIDFKYLYFYAGDSFERDAHETLDASWCDIATIQKMDQTIFKYLRALT